MKNKIQIKNLFIFNIDYIINLRHIIYFFLIFQFFNTANCVPLSILSSGSGNLRDVNWSLYQQDNIKVYVNNLDPELGRYALFSIQKAYPYLSQLLGVQIGNNPNTQFNSKFLQSPFSNIVLILGDKTEGAGFANPATQNIETQLIHPRFASFFQHELVHRIMYEHHEFHLGLIGRSFSLAMMPTWWIEGLAEHLTESIGRTETEVKFRNIALQNFWPTWERLHSLYQADNDTNTRGYIVSGRFLGWILSKIPSMSYAQIHEEIATQTIIPLFYTASDYFLKKHLNLTGKELYEQFKLEKTEEIKNDLNAMPSILKSSISPVIFSEDKAYIPFFRNNIVTISKMTSPSSTIQSSILISQINNESSLQTRIPVSVNGSPIISHPLKTDGMVLTTKWIQYSNATYGNELILLKYAKLFDQNEKQIIEFQKSIPFSSKDNPYVVQEIEKAGNGEFFIHASLRSQSYLFYLNSNNNKIINLKKFSYPEFPQLIGSSNNLKNTCVLAIIKRDFEENSVEELCNNLQNKIIIPKNTLNLLDGYLLTNKSIRLLVSWGNNLGFVDYENGKIKPIAAIPDWVEKIYPINNNDQYFSAWIYLHGLYHLVKFDVQKLSENFNAWQKTLTKQSIYKTKPEFVKYIPIFQKIYIKENLAQQNKSTSISDASLSPIQIKPQAPFTHRFLLAIPYGLPADLGGPSINLFAIPYQDEIERDAIQIFAGYNFYLNSPSGAITYVNHRILDGFELSLFSKPFFNGAYITSSNNNYYLNYNYLLQQGLALSLVYNFLPSTFRLQQSILLSNLKPYSKLTQAPVELGAQKFNLLQISENLFMNLFEKSFYLTKNQKPNDSQLIWKADLKLGFEKFNSISKTMNILNETITNINYANYNAALSSKFLFFHQRLTFNAYISTTKGPNTLNIKEYYSPYDNKILGVQNSLSIINLPVIASQSLFDLSFGDWSQDFGINYSFPILLNGNCLFLMAYLDNWRGILNFSEGGTWVSNHFDERYDISSVTIGTQFRVDMKGFQMVPTISYTQLISKKGFGIIFKLKMMDLI